MRQIQLLLAALLVVFAGCDDPAAAHASSRTIQVIEQSHEVNGVLSSIEATIQLLTEDSLPVVGEPVLWVAEEAGSYAGQAWGLGKNAVGRAWISAGLAVDTVVTDSVGQARQRYWVLGPGVGEQRLTVAADGAEEVFITARAEAGIVLLGVWENVDSQNQLPSDTFRVHASHAYWVEETERNAESGDTLWVQGFFALGSGINDEWPFHLIPWTAHAHVPLNSLPQCSGPPASLTEVQEAIDANVNQICEDVLRLVRIDSLGTEYLARLQGGADG